MRTERLREKIKAFLADNIDDKDETVVKIGISESLAADLAPYNSNTDISVKDSPGTFVASRDITIEGDFTQNIGVSPEKHAEALEEAEKQKKIANDAITTASLDANAVEANLEAWGMYIKRSFIRVIVTILLLLSLFYFFGWSWELFIISIIIWLIVTGLNLSVFITKPELFD
jgi:hypothetical protein